jgi:stage V sporulation protein S
MAMEGAGAVTESKPKPVIFVKPSTPVGTISGIITSSIEEDEVITLRSIGAGALNQAVKGIIQARQQLAAQGYDLTLVPGFQTVAGNDGGDVTAIVLRCRLI